MGFTGVTASAAPDDAPTTRPVDVDNPFLATSEELPEVVTPEPTGLLGSIAEMVKSFNPSGMTFKADVVEVTEVPDVAEEADTSLIAPDQIEDDQIRVTVNDSRIVRTSRPYTRVAIGRDDLADVRPLGAQELLVTAKRPGTTQVVFWDENDQSETVLLRSSADLRAIQERLDELIPGTQIRLVDLGGMVGVDGRARDADEAERAMTIVRSFAQPENLMEMAGGQQVALRIRFAEVTRTAGKEFGVNFGFTDSQGTVAGSRIGQISPLAFFRDTAGAVTGLGIPDPNTGAQIFGLATNNGDPLAYYINALRESNLLRVLADPELIVASGEEGEFLAGGEYPIPVPQEEGIAIEYRDFGIRLAYSPVVLGDGRIRMQLRTEVSDLDDTIALSIGGTRVPGLRTRTTATTVEMRDGQSLAISGLLRSNITASKSAVPLLGDVPVVGALFRSVRYQREETELVVLITPRLVAPLDPDQVGPLPGETWEQPGDIDLFVFGQLGGDAGVSLPDDADVDGSDNRARGPNAPVRRSLKTSYAFTPVEPTE